MKSKFTRSAFRRTKDDVDLLCSIVENIQSSPEHKITVPLKVRASVAIILRLCPASNDFHNENFISNEFGFVSAENLRAYFSGCGWTSNAQLQILYIRRAESATDYFSKQVAFPGGRNESPETDLETAMRETREEIGLDLSDRTRFAAIGPLRERSIFRLKLPPMALSQFVFVQLTPTSPPVTLSTGEVGCYRWVPLRFLLQKKEKIFTTHPLPVDTSFPRIAQWPHPLRNLLGITSISFPAYMLPSPEPPYCIVHVEDGRGKDGFALPDNKAEFKLWGLTLWSTSELFRDGTTRRSWKHLDWPYVYYQGPLMPLTLPLTMKLVSRFGYFPLVTHLMALSWSVLGTALITATFGTYKLFKISRL